MRKRRRRQNNRRKIALLRNDTGSLGKICIPLYLYYPYTVSPMISKFFLSSHFFCPDERLENGCNTALPVKEDDDFEISRHNEEGNKLWMEREKAAQEEWSKEICKTEVLEKAKHLQEVCC